MSATPPPVSPYAPPRSDAGNGGPPYATTFAQGVEWVGEAFGLFKRAPVPWVLFALAFFAAQLALSSIQLVGNALAGVLSPLVFAGATRFAADLARGAPPRFETFFSGFSAPWFGQALLLGVFSLLATLLLAGFAIACIFVAVGASALTGLFQGDFTALPGQALLFALLVLVVLLVGAALYSMAFLLAPARVALAGRSAVDAIADSLAACLSGWRGLTSFGLAMLMIGIIAAIPLFLGWLVVFPVSLAAMYVMHRDLFGGDSPTSDTRDTRASSAERSAYPPPPPPPPGGAFGGGP